MSWKDEADKIYHRRELAKEQGGSEAIARQHNKGRLTIRERIDALLDKGSFDEIGQGAGDAEDPRTDDQHLHSGSIPMPSARRL